MAAVCAPATGPTRPTSLTRLRRLELRSHSGCDSGTVPPPAHAADTYIHGPTREATGTRAQYRSQ